MLALLCQIATNEEEEAATLHRGGPPSIQRLVVPSSSRPSSAGVVPLSSAPPPPHPVLSNETAKSIILRFHQQRAHLQRALEVCAKHGLPIPEVLLEALHFLITDTQPGGAMAIDGRAPTPAAGANRYGCRPGSAATATGLSPNGSRLGSPATGNRPNSAAALCGEAMSLTRKKLNMDISEFTAAPHHTGGRSAASRPSSAVSVHSEAMADATDAATTTTVEAHIAVTQHAFANHPTHPGRIIKELRRTQDAAKAEASGTVPPFVPSNTSAVPRQLLEAAHAARRSGNLRLEIATLIDFLRRGQAGSIPLDTSATTRVLRMLADAHVALGEFVSAEQYLFDWYMIAEKAGDRADSVRALVQLGACSHTRGDIAAAKDWLTQAKMRAPGRLRV